MQAEAVSLYFYAIHVNEIDKARGEDNVVVGTARIVRRNTTDPESKCWQELTKGKWIDLVDTSQPFYGIQIKKIANRLYGCLVNHKSLLWFDLTTETFQMVDLPSLKASCWGVNDYHGKPVVAQDNQLWVYDHKKWRSLCPYHGHAILVQDTVIEQHDDVLVIRKLNDDEVSLRKVKVTHSDYWLSTDGCFLYCRYYKGIARIEEYKYYNEELFLEKRDLNGKLLATIPLSTNGTESTANGDIYQSQTVLSSPLSYQLVKLLDDGKKFATSSVAGYVTLV